MIRAGFRTLDRVAPGLAARWALRIWCTVPRQRRVRRRFPPAPPGARFTIPLGATRGATRGWVVAEAWGEGPVTYLLHGWGGYRGQLAALVEPLVAAGQRVVALDTPGHGESGPGRLGGRRSTLPEMAEALAAVVTVAGPAHAVVAHSAGAAATALATRDGLTAGRLVFLAPAPNPVSYLDRFARLLGLGNRTQAGVLRRLERLVGRDLADFDAPARAAQAAPGTLPPLLVVHDRDDREVPYAGGSALAGAWPGADLVTTEGLGHRRILADPAVIEATVSFVTAQQATPTLATAAGSTGHS